VLNTHPVCWAVPGLTNDMKVLEDELKSARRPATVRGPGHRDILLRARKYVGAFLAAMGGGRTR